MLKATQISKVYKTSRGEVTALAPCSLEFAESGLVLICGESGGGKTTLLNILAGTDVPSSGGVQCSYGKNYGAFVFQGGRLSDSLTVEENFKLIEKIFPERCADFRDQAQKFGIHDLLNRKPSELSFGEVQRAAILRAAMANRPVLFADEPTANLDEENSRKVADLLKDISRRRLVIVSTHEREYFEDIADRIIFLKRGNIVSDTRKSEEKNSESADGKGGAAGGAELAGKGPKGRQTDPRSVAADNFVVNNSAPRFGIGTAFWLAGKTLRRTAVAVALTMVFLVVCLFSLITCTNIFFADDIGKTVAAVRADGSPVFELKRDYVSFTEIFDESFGRHYGESIDLYFNDGDDYSPISDEQFEELSEQYGAVPFYDSSSLFSAPGSRDGIPVRRIYVSDTCFFPVAYGSAELGEGIAISVAAAERYGRYFGADSAEDMLGKQAGGYTITCIYSAESAAYDGYVLSGEMSEDFEGRIIMSEGAFLRDMEVDGEFPVYAYLYDPDYSSGVEFLRYTAYPCVEGREDSYYTPVYGDGGPKEGEVYVSEKYASRHGGVEALLGTQVSYDVITADGGYVTFTFTVTGAFHTVYSDFNAVFSQEDARKIWFVGGEWRMDDRSGICLPEYQPRDIYELKEAGYSENSYLSENISDAKDWFETLTGILAIVCAVSAVCAFAALVFYAVYAFAKCGREVGILRSFGLSPVRTSAVFFCQLLVAAAASLVLGTLIGLVAIPAWNAAAFSAAGAMTVYFAPLCLAAAAVAAVAAFAVGALFIYLSALKKSSARFLRED